MEVLFPFLAIAAHRLEMDEGELAEAVLHAIGIGYPEMEAMRMTIIEILQRRGAYHGRLKQAIDDGTIFQMEAKDSNTTARGEPEKITWKGVRSVQTPAGPPEGGTMRVHCDARYSPSQWA